MGAKRFVDSDIKIAGPTGLRAIAADYSAGTKGSIRRSLTYWITRGFVGVFSYRLQRQMFLWLGRGWGPLRVLLTPFFALTSVYSGVDIDYRAAIGPGMKILHPVMGVVVSQHSIIGRNLTLTGGNVLGGGAGLKGKHIVIGDNFHAGPNAIVLGPCTLGNYVLVSAGSVVVKDAGDHVTLIGNPASGIMSARSQKLKAAHEHTEQARGEE